VSDNIAISYIWSQNGTGTSSTTQGTAIGVYEVQVTDINGCVGNGSGTLSTVPLPSITVNNEEICEGDPAVTFTATSDIPATAYLWSENGTGTNMTTTGTADGNYTVLVTDINGCQNSGTGVLNVTPAPTVTLTPSNPSFCVGDSVEIKAENVDPGATVIWTPAQSPSGTRSFFVKSGDPLTYSISINFNGCNSLPGNSVIVSEDTIPLVKTDTVRFCKGSTTTLTIANPQMLYTWVETGETTQSIEVSAQHNYLFYVTDPISNCRSLTDSIFADENPDPTPQIALSPDDSLCFAKGESVDIVAFLVKGSQEGTLEWSNGFLDDTMLTYLDTGDVWVFYTDTFNCSGSDTVHIYNYCKPPIVEVPNVVIIGDCNTCSPFTPVGNITPEDVVSGRMEVYDRWGLKMYETNDLIPSWDAKYNGNAVSAGVYFWIWVYEDVTKTQHNLNGFVEILTK
jgi:hypothetical protein